jgi:hypothetical protein
MYRIQGEGVTPTGTFGIPPSQPNTAVRLHVHSGSLGARIGGVWLLIGGITFAVSGGLIAGIAAAESSVLPDTGLLVTGGVMGGIGVVMTVLGAVLLAGSGTSVTTDDGITVARHAPAKPHFNGSGFTF